MHRIRTRVVFVILFVLFLLLPSFILSAHPHTFIDTQMRIVLEGESLKGLEITWYFDPMFTGSILHDFDTNSDRKFGQAEVQEIRAYAFSNLVNYDYFTFIEVGDNTYVPEVIESFTAYMDGKTLVYRFFTPFDIPVPPEGLKIAIYDDTFFCDILYHEESPVVIDGDTPAEWEIVENRNKEIYYSGPVSVSREDRDYSGVAYPQQVVLALK